MEGHGDGGSSFATILSLNGEILATGREGVNFFSAIIRGLLNLFKLDDMLNVLLLSLSNLSLIRRGGGIAEATVVELRTFISRIIASIFLVDILAVLAGDLREIDLFLGLKRVKGCFFSRDLLSLLSRGLLKLTVQIE